VADLDREGYLDPALNELWAEYKRSCPPPEVDASFMPRLWQRIDSRRRFTLDLRRLSRTFVTAAAAICLAIAGVLLIPYSSAADSYYAASYLDVLDSDDAPVYALVPGDLQ
jgi:hypothetical protein